LWALLVIPLVILVGAARLNLRRHTLSQVLAGSVVGVIVPALLLLAAA
jgi:membrane-associated phospholipid phosphatase